MASLENVWHVLLVIFPKRPRFLAHWGHWFRKIRAILKPEPNINRNFYGNRAVLVGAIQCLEMYSHLKGVSAVIEKDFQTFTLRTQTIMNRVHALPYPDLEDARSCAVLTTLKRIISYWKSYLSILNDSAMWRSRVSSVQDRLKEQTNKGEIYTPMLSLVSSLVDLVEYSIGISAIWHLVDLIFFPLCIRFTWHLFSDFTSRTVFDIKSLDSWLSPLWSYKT